MFGLTKIQHALLGMGRAALLAVGKATRQTYIIGRRQTDRQKETHTHTDAHTQDTGTHTQTHTRT